MLTCKQKIRRLWSRHACTLRELPLYHLDVLPTNKNEVAVDNCINTHVTKLQELKTHISICHLTTQSMTSTFDEFQYMVKKSKFDIITLSETWLKNDKHRLEYVNLPGICQFVNLLSPTETEMRKELVVQAFI